MNRRENDPEAIEREIEDTRQRIDSTLSELGERLSPGQLLDQALDYVRGASGPRRFASNLGHSVQDHPLPVVLVGIGLAWLAFGPERSYQGGGVSTQRFAGDGDEAFASEGRNVLENASEAAHGAASAARDAASAVGARVQHTRERTREAASRLSEGAQRGAHRARSAWAYVRDEQPLVLALAGLALGAALGGAMPPTESEDALLGEKRDDVLARGARAAREGGEALRERVERAAEEASPEPH
jgi:ElaB/YqjD/DUF883 family membrane-anchored ribosome-binding protein